MNHVLPPITSTQAGFAGDVGASIGNVLKKRMDESEGPNPARTPSRAGLDRLFEDADEPLTPPVRASVTPPPAATKVPPKSAPVPPPPPVVKLPKNEQVMTLADLARIQEQERQGSAPPSQVAAVLEDAGWSAHDVARSLPPARTTEKPKAGAAMAGAILSRMFGKK